MVFMYCTSARIDAGTLYTLQSAPYIWDDMYYTIADIICYYILYIIYYYIQYTPFVTILTPYITILGKLLDVKCYLRPT